MVGTRTDCVKCMEANSRIVRQGWACPFEPPAPPNVPVMPWQPPLGRLGYSYDAPKVCAGYLVRLPQVREAVVARAHWLKGELSTFLDGARASEELGNAIVELEGAYNDSRTYWTTPVKDGGGRV